MTPVRLSFSGGGTDMPEYYKKYGGLIFPKYLEEHRESSTLQRTTVHIYNLVLDTLRLDYSPKEMIVTRIPTMNTMWNVIQLRLEEVTNN